MEIVDGYASVFWSWWGRFRRGRVDIKGLRLDTLENLPDRVLGPAETLVYSVLALVPMLQAHARLARLYLVASGAGIGACAARLVTAVLPDHLQDTFTASIIVWFLACSCGAAFALISGYSWLQRQRALIGAAP